MKKVRKNYKAMPPINGIMSCPKDHKWNVRNLNQERVIVNCPICGIPSSIRQGLIKL